MFALLVSENNLPAVISMESNSYPELIMKGYQPIATGYRKQMEDMERDIMEGLCSQLEYNEDYN